MSGPMQKKVFHVTDKGRRKDTEQGTKKTLLSRSKETRKMTADK